MASSTWAAWFSTVTCSSHSCRRMVTTSASRSSGGIGLHNPRRHDRDILSDQSCIEAIVLGQNATGAGELPKLVRIDPSNRQACGEQRTDDTPLVSAAWLDADRGERRTAQSLNQLRPSQRRCSRPKSPLDQAAPSHPNDPSIRRCHQSAPPSSCPFLADAGSCPCNCPGMEETTGAPGSFAVCQPRRLRASGRDGGGVMNRPPSPFSMLLSRHTRRREFIALAAAAALAPTGCTRAIRSNAHDRYLVER